MTEFLENESLHSFLIVAVGGVFNILLILSLVQVTLLITDYTSMDSYRQPDRHNIPVSDQSPPTDVIRKEAKGKSGIPQSEVVERVTQILNILLKC